MQKLAQIVRTAGLIAMGAVMVFGLFPARALAFDGILEAYDPNQGMPPWNYVVGVTNVSNAKVVNWSVPPNVGSGPAEVVFNSEKITVTGGTISHCYTGGFEVVGSTETSCTLQATIDYAPSGIIIPFDFTPSVVGPLTFTATVYSSFDGTGVPLATASYVVNVEANNTAPTVGAINVSANPVKTQAPVTASAIFNDENTADTHQATWNWGDGTTSAGTVTENSGAGNVTGSHTYSSPGMYEVTLTVTDQIGASATQTFQYLSAYKASLTGLFLTVGTFQSPPGAVVANPGATGVTAVNVVARYGLNAQPTGSVNVSSAAAGIQFNSNNISALVLANGTATLRATGTFNGVAGHTALITGVGSLQSGGGMVRVQVKNPSGTIVYDSHMGATDVAAPNNALSGLVLVRP